jgi:hypothetical protein
VGFRVYAGQPDSEAGVTAITGLFYARRRAARSAIMLAD